MTDDIKKKDNFKMLSEISSSTAGVLSVLKSPFILFSCLRRLAEGGIGLLHLKDMVIK